MKKKINLRKWGFNYLCFGIVPYYILCLYFGVEINLKLKNILYDILFTLLTMFLLYPFKKLFNDYKEAWKTAELDRKIFIVLGIIFVVYGVYYRAKVSGTFK